jgi:hypothetical protein
MHSYTNGGPVAATLLPPIPTQTIVGAGLANRHLDKRQRAVLAADVLDGTMRLNPSQKQLADIFGVSVVYIAIAQKLSPGRRAAILRGWDPTPFTELMPRRSAMLPAPNLQLEHVIRAVGVERVLEAAVAVESA